MTDSKKTAAKKNFESFYPLSPTQQGILFHSLAATAGSGMYVGQMRFRLEGALDEEALRRAWGAVLARHGALRTAFRWKDLKEPIQVVAKRVELPFETLDWRDLDPGAQDARLDDLLRADLERGFDLATAPLLRLTLIRRADEVHELLWTRHHLIVDGWSVSLVFQEVLRHYVASRQGVTPDLDPAPKYRDYIVWQRKQKLATAEAAWREELAGLDDGAPFDYGTAETHDPTALAGDDRWGEVATEVPWDVTAALAELTKCQGPTLASWVQGAWAILLGRLQNRDDVLFGTVVSGRPAALPGVQGMVGLFINTQPLRATLDDTRPTLDWVRELQDHQAALRHHEHLALHQIQGWSGVPRGREMFETLLVYENYPVDPLGSDVGSDEGAGRDLAGIDIVPILGRERTNYPLTLIVRQGRTLPITAIFDRGRLARGDVARLLDHLVRLLAAAADDPARPVADLPWLSESERRQLLAEWQGPEVEVDAEATLDGLVRRQAERTPDAIAVEQGDDRLTYAELVERGDRFAATLRTAGVGEGDLVALGLERSPALLVALLAVHRLGAAYVPLDPDYPRARLALMLEDARPRALVAEPTSDLATLAAEGCPVVAVDRSSDSGVGELPPRRPFGDALAYVIYTSGSTGRPKGVQIPHRTVVNFLAAMARRPGLGADDVLLAVTSLSFDISVLELFLPLAVGARVVVARREEAADGRLLRERIAASGATVLQATPATWRLLDAAGFRATPGFRQLSGGEALGRELAHRLLDGDGALWNLYGPTETTIWSSVAEVRVEPGASGAVDLGKPIDNTQLHAVDRHGRLLPAGVPGELWIGGDGLARGYLDRPALTAERFVPDPWSPRPGRRLYRTGDLVRRRGEGPRDTPRAPGIFDYLGRIDFQVKVRGHRIELGEVEAVLERLAEVGQAVAVVRRDTSGEGRLVAYVVPADGARPTVDGLRRDAGRELPAVMVPAIFVTLDAFPLTPNGKVDRKALPEPGGERPDLGTELVRPRTELERTLAKTWAKTLELDEVGLEDNFFDLGGHSILAIRVHEEIVATLGVELTLVELFEHPTIATLARRIGQLQGATAEIESTPARRRTRSVEDDPGIAVVGMAGRFPGAPSVAALWRNLLDGVEGVRDFTAEEIADVGRLGLGSGDPSEPGLVTRRGVLDDVDRFDAPFFGINPREAELLDPQHRLFLEVASQALDDASHPDESAGPIGVFAGTSMSGYLLHHVVPHLQRRGFDAAWQMVLGNDKDHLATRVAYLLGLTGPAVLVQTACSTSLVAVHMARRALLAGECDLALAGGAAVRVPQTLPLRHQPGGITSPDGRCRPFDAAADGTVGGNGVAAVVLRRLDDALADGDTIHAVIRGSAINNDGHHKVGYTAPSIEGQSRAIRAALDEADIDPATIGFVEGHGTGTALGDPIEVTALHRAFAVADRPASCALGSLKGNLGHLDTAAGIAGLIKAVLAVEHGVVPPTLHFDTPSPRIPWQQGPFFVPAEPTPWPQTEGPRRAGVSSFGLGGTNAHVVLEEGPVTVQSPDSLGPSLSPHPLTPSPGFGRGGTGTLDTPASEPVQADDRSDRQAESVATAGVAGASERKLSVPRRNESGQHDATSKSIDSVADQGPEGVGERPEATPAVAPMTQSTLLLSAKTQTALDRTTANLANHLAEHPDLDLRDVAFTLAIGRRHHSHRRAVTAATLDEAVAALRGEAPTHVRETTVDGRPAWTAFLFPGQGTAWARMGRELYERPGVFRNVLETCDAILREPLGESLLDTLYGPAASDEALAQTRLAQPAVFALSHALAEQWKAWGIEADVLLGHSVGEYVAAHRAGVFDLESALRLVARRGALMQSLPPGAMLVLPVSAERLTELLADFTAKGGELLDLAAENGPDATVISGSEATVERFARHLEAQKIQGRRLRTSHAFHSAMMDPILDAFGEEVSRHRLAPPRARVLSNFDGRPLTAEQATSADYWVRHLRGTVRFGPGLATLLAEEGAGLLLEVGPGRSLSALARRQVRTAERSKPARVVASLSRGRGETPDDANQALHRAVDSVWLAGAAVDWNGVLESRNDDDRPKERAGRRISLPPTAFDDHRYWLDPEAAAPADPGLHLHWPGWRQAGAPAVSPEAANLTLLVPEGADTAPLGTVPPGVTVEVVTLDLDTLEALHERLATAPTPWVWPGPGWIEGPAGWHREQLPRVVDTFADLASDDGRLVILGRGGEEVLGTEPLEDDASVVRAVVQWARRRELTVSSVDAAPGAPVPWGELATPIDESRAAIRGAFRWLPETRAEIPGPSADDTEAKRTVALADGTPASVALAESLTGEGWRLVDLDDLESEQEPLDLLVAHVGPPDDTLTEALDRVDATIDRLASKANDLGASAVLLHHDLADLRGHDLVALAVAEHAADRVRRLDTVRRFDRDDAIRWRLLAWDHQGSTATPSDRRRLTSAIDRLLQVGGPATAWVGPADLEGWLATTPTDETDETDEAPAGFRPDTGTPFAAPEGETEAALATIWEDLLGVSPVGRFDDFFELGGHSLLGTQMMARVTAVLGRELPLRTLFDTPTLEALARALDSVTTSGDGAVPTIPKVERDGPLPLSFAQQRLWFLDQLEPGSAIYNLPFALRLDGTLERRALRSAVTALVARHEVLRTRFGSERGEPRQTIDPMAEQPLPVVDLGGLPDARQQGEARRIARIEGRTAFDLGRGELLRTRLLRLADDDHVLAVTVHHIAADGWSLGVLVRELGALYRRANESEVTTLDVTALDASELPALPIQYADFAAWQREWLAGERLELQLDHWRQRLAGAPTALDLPTDRPRPAVIDATGGEVRFALPAPVVDAARALARTHGATLFMVLLAAFDALLHRLTGQDDLLVGSPVANRTRVEVEGLIGFFVNTLVLRTDLADSPDFAAVVERVKETSLDAQAHQDVPFELLVQELQPERDLSRSPLFQVLFILQNTPIERLELPGLSLSPMPVATGAATFDLTLSLSERDNVDGPTLGGVLGYRRDLFDQTTVERFASQFARLLAAAVATPDTPVTELPLLTEAERRQLAELAVGPALPPAPKSIEGRDDSLPDRLLRRVSAEPEAVAVLTGQGTRVETTTWATLGARAGQIGERLRDLGVGAETRVGVALARNADLVATLWGVMAAGGTFVPLDPGHPAARLRAVIEDADLALLVTDAASSGPFADFDGPRLDLARLEAAGRTAQALDELADLPGPVSADALAYVLFTSGSTGRPKGVAIRHGALLGFLDAMARRPGLDASDTLAAITTLSFDISMLELFLPLIQGGRLALVDADTAADPHALARRLDAVEATVMQATPAGWHQLLEAGWTNPRGLRVLCGGEALPRPLADRLAACSPQVWNLYGPTEATVWIGVAEVREGEGYHDGVVGTAEGDAVDDRPRWPVDLGRPLPGARLEVLDRRLRPVPLGVAGELYLAGPALARGYFGLPARTAAAFVPDPLGDVPGGRLYRTGDLVRRDAQGRLIFLGRVDHQVKVRGFRIELGEIEAALLRHPAVRQAVVVARGRDGGGQGGGDSELVAYVVAGDANGESGEGNGPTAAEWRAFLADQVPAYMVPTAFVGLDAFPTNTSGKIDRKALPEPERGRGSSVLFVAPRDPVEEAVAAIWCEVLALEEVGIHDGFFDLGGHSLLATQVTSRVFEAFQIELPLRQLFADPTVAGLSEAVREAQAESLDSAEEALLRQIESMSDDDLDDELAKLLASEVESP